MLRKIGDKYLPKKISETKKLGFPLPMNDWMKDKKGNNIVKNIISKDFKERNELVKNIFKLSNKKKKWNRKILL